MSRLKQAHPGVRPALKARAMLSGPPGSGKTRSGLIIGHLLGERVLVIDTEEESALTYADEFKFDHLPWAPPYNPRELASTITEASEQYDVIQVDSVSHFWQGDGGTLDIAGGKFTGWDDARPAQDDLIKSILRAKCHMLICARSKLAHEQVNENGRWVVKKLGMSIIQDGTIEYELNVALEFFMDHSFAVSKSRCTVVPVGREFKSGHAEDFAHIYKDWLAAGEQLARQDQVDGFKRRMNALPEKARASVKQEFVSHIGHPDRLRESQLEDAEALVAGWEAKAATGEGEARPEPTPAAPQAASEAADGPSAPAQAPTTEAIDWTAEAKGRGLTQSLVLKEARALCESANLDAPPSLPHIPEEVAPMLYARLVELAAARNVP